MAKEEFYRQCTLVKKSENGETRTVSWIPEKGISVGCTLRLKDPITNEYMDGRWTVASMGQERRSAKYVKERIRLARRYRQATDV